jgi:hypothetical protein
MFFFCLSSNYSLKHTQHTVPEVVSHVLDLLPPELGGGGQQLLQIRPGKGRHSKLFSVYCSATTEATKKNMSIIARYRVAFNEKKEVYTKST